MIIFIRRHAYLHPWPNSSFREEERDITQNAVGCMLILATQRLSFCCNAASTKDQYSQNIVAEGAPHKQADAFDYGGGHVDANRAADPGLVYDTEISDYVCLLCSMGYNSSAIGTMTGKPTQCKESSNCLRNLNSPSIVIPNLKQRVTVSRIVTNVGPMNSIYTARVEAPVGTHVRVKPSILSFNSSMSKLKFRVIFHSLLSVQGRYSFGNLFWEDGLHEVRIPLVVRTIIDDFYAQT